MSHSVADKEKVENVIDNQDDPALVCRGCLKNVGEMKNIFQWGLDADFFKYTDIPNTQCEGMSELLCETCEVDLQNAKTFKDRCQQSDKILRTKLRKKKKTSSIPTTQVTSVLHNNKLIFLITSSNPNDKIILQCPHNKCTSEFLKKTLLLSHLHKSHNAGLDFIIEQQFFCSENKCPYNMSSEPTKFFLGRKYLNQHYNKTHKDKAYTCETCNLKFSIITDYYRHLKSCNVLYVCPLCTISYTTNESYLVHLKRRHPEIHAKYKQDKKAQKRLVETNFTETTAAIENINPKKIKNGTERNEIDIKLQEQDSESNNVRKFNPFHLNINVFETKIPPTAYTAFSEIDNAKTNIATGDTIEENRNKESINNEITVAEDYIIEEIVHDEFSENQNGEKTLGDIVEKHIIPQEYVNENASNEIECHISQNFVNDNASNDSNCHKKTSSTQIPEEINYDVSLNSWSNKNDFEIQNEMSTQTVFEDLLSLKSQHSEDEIFFSESVSLSDIQTQTAPLEFGLSRCNKETQSLASQTQYPDLSIKETQTCFCLYDSPKLNFRLFDSLAPSPGSSNFISTETQTGDINNIVKSDVLFSFTSAETQTCFDDSSNSSM